MKYEEIKYVGYDGTQMFLSVYRPDNDNPRALLIVLHGLGSHAGDFREIGKYFAERGLAVYIPDLRGFGHYSGLKGHIMNFEEFVEDMQNLVMHAKDRYLNKITFVFGSSLGGLIAARYVTKYSREIDGLILQCPAVSQTLEISLGKKIAGNILSLLNVKRYFPSDVNHEDASRNPKIVKQMETDPLRFELVTPRFGIEGLIRKKAKKRLIRVHNKTSDIIEQYVLDLAYNNNFDGVVTLADKLLDEYNVTLNPSTIYRILKRKNVRYTDQQPVTRKRWKKQLYAHKQAGLELQMDTKYPFGYKMGKVIYTIIDDASRWAFVWTYKTANGDNTVDFFKKVLERAPFTIQKVRTDQGTEFVNGKLKTLLEKYGIIYRKNTPYCPEENGKIERFHRTLNQKGLRYGFYPTESIPSLQYKLNLFMHYYNYKKRHRGLGMDGLTPMKKLNKLKSVNFPLQCYKN